MNTNMTIGKAKLVFSGSGPLAESIGTGNYASRVNTVTLSDSPSNYTFNGSTNRLASEIGLPPMTFTSPREFKINSGSDARLVVIKHNSYVK